MEAGRVENFGSPRPALYNDQTSIGILMDTGLARTLLPARICSFYGGRIADIVRTNGDRWDTKKHITVVLTTTRDVWEYGPYPKRQWNRLSSTPRTKRK